MDQYISKCKDCESTVNVESLNFDTRTVLNQIRRAGAAPAVQGSHRKISSGPSQPFHYLMNGLMLLALRRHIGRRSKLSLRQEPDYA